MRTSISIPDKLYKEIKKQVEEQGFMSINDFLLSLVRDKVNTPPPLPEQYVEHKKAPRSFATMSFDLDMSKPTPMMPPAEYNSRTIPEDVPSPNLNELQSWLASLPPVAPTLNVVPPVQPTIPEQFPKPTLPPQPTDSYIAYGGKCQYKTISSDDLMCLESASKKLSVALNQTGEVPPQEDFVEVYLCPIHTAEVSHSSRFFVNNT